MKFMVSLSYSMCAIKSSIRYCCTNYCEFSTKSGFVSGPLDSTLNHSHWIKPKLEGIRCKVHLVESWSRFYNIQLEMCRENPLLRHACWSAWLKPILALKPKQMDFPEILFMTAKYWMSYGESVQLLRIRPIHQLGGLLSVSDRNVFSNTPSLIRFQCTYQ